MTTEPDAEVPAEEEPALTGVWSPGRRMLTAGLVLVVTLAASEALVVATVLPIVERDLGSLDLYGWVFSAFFLGNLIGIVIAGRAADRMPVTVPFAAGLILFFGGLLLGGLAPTMLVLVAARGLQGLGAGALPAVAYVCIGRGYEPGARPRMFALLSTAWIVPSLIGPAVAGFVGERWGWRIVFLGLLPLVVGIGGLALVGVRRIPATDVHPDETHGLLRDAVLVSAGAGLLLAGLGAKPVGLAVVLVVAGVLLGLPAFRRLVPPGTLRASPGLPAAVLSRGTLTFAFFAADAYVPLALTTVRGVSAGATGIVLTLSSMTWTIGAWVQERRIHRGGPRALVRVGFAIVAVAAVLFALVMVEGIPLWVAYFAWALGGLGIGLAYAPVSTVVLGEAEPGREGRASAALQLTDTLGVALGTGVGGVLVATAAAAGWSNAARVVPVYVLSASVAVAGTLLARRLPRQMR